VHDDLRYHAEEEEFEETQGETEVCPIMAVFHHFEAISFEVDLSIEVHLVKSFHWNSVLARIFYSVILIMKMQVVLNRSTRISSLLVLAR
jgi:hypothetical protein